MTAHKGLALDANILIRAVLGKRVRSLLEAYEDSTNFYAPDVCFEEAYEHLPILLGKRGLDRDTGLLVLDQIGKLVRSVGRDLYLHHEEIARERVRPRDVEDWPVVALAMTLNLAIWTEDQDLFGSGIATWTTDRVELYLRDR
jgi:predicted nucleic acid-binding protein